MSLIEKILLVAMGLTPIVALLFMLPKLKRKKQQTFETTDYVPLEKEQAENNQPNEVAEVAPQEKSVEHADELEDYRAYLSKRKQETTKPTRVDVPEGYIDRTEGYSMARMRKKAEQKTDDNSDLLNLPADVQALLIAGILDRKF